MFGAFARMDDEGFSRGMDRLGAYAERFGAGNPMFRNFRMPQNVQDVVNPDSPGGAVTAFPAPPSTAMLTPSRAARHPIR